MGGQDREVAEVTVAAGVVEAIADDELVGDVETDVLDGHIHLSRRRLAEHRHDLEAGGPAAGQVRDQVAQRQAGGRRSPGFRRDGSGGVAWLDRKRVKPAEQAFRTQVADSPTKKTVSGSGGF